VPLTSHFNFVRGEKDPDDPFQKCPFKKLTVTYEVCRFFIMQSQLAVIRTGLMMALSVAGSFAQPAPVIGRAGYALNFNAPEATQWNVSSVEHTAP
jgi:hypothetical protein